MMASTTRSGQTLNQLRAEIISIAKQKANKIMQEGSAKIAEIKQDLEQKRTLLQEKRLREITDELGKELVDVKKALDHDRASSVLHFKQETLDGVIEEIRSAFCQKMLDDPDYYYGTYLADNIKETLAMLSFKEYYISLNARDAHYVQKHDFLKQFGKKIIVRDEHFPDDDIGCIIGDRTSSIKVDRRLSKKIDSKENYLKTKLSPILFSE